MEEEIPSGKLYSEVTLSEMTAHVSLILCPRIHVVRITA